MASGFCSKDGWKPSNSNSAGRIGGANRSESTTWCSNVLPWHPRIQCSISSDPVFYPQCLVGCSLPEPPSTDEICQVSARAACTATKTANPSHNRWPPHTLKFSEVEACQRPRLCIRIAVLRSCSRTDGSSFCGERAASGHFSAGDGAVYAPLRQPCRVGLLTSDEVNFVAFDFTRQGYRGFFYRSRGRCSVMNCNSSLFRSGSWAIWALDRSNP